MSQLIIFLAQYFIVIDLLLAGIYVIYLFKNKKTIFIKLAKLSILSLPISYLSAKILQHVINDPRPFVVNHAIKPLFAHAPDNGFPSDHTLLTMTVAAIIFSYNRKLGILLALFSLVIGFARVAAGVHHSLDIIGAAVIAIAATALSFFVLQYIAGKKEDKSIKLHNK